MPETGSRWIQIVGVGPAKTARIRGPLDDTTYRRLQEPGLRFQTRVQGRDYDVLGWPQRRFGPVTLFALGAGLMILGRTSRHRASGSQRDKTPPQELKKDAATASAAACASKSRSGSTSTRSSLPSSASPIAPRRSER